MSDVAPPGVSSTVGPSFKYSSFVSSPKKDGNIILADDKDHLVISAQITRGQNGEEKITFITAPNTWWGRTLQYFQGTSANKRIIRKAIAAYDPEKIQPNNLLRFLKNNPEARQTLSNLLKVQSIQPLVSAATDNKKLQDNIETAVRASRDFKMFTRRLPLIFSASDSSPDAKKQYCNELITKYEAAKNAWEKINISDTDYQNMVNSSNLKNVIFKTGLRTYMKYRLNDTEYLLSIVQYLQIFAQELLNQDKLSLTQEEKGTDAGRIAAQLKSLFDESIATYVTCKKIAEQIFPDVVQTCEKNCESAKELKAAWISKWDNLTSPDPMARPITQAVAVGKYFAKQFPTASVEIIDQLPEGEIHTTRTNVHPGQHDATQSVTHFSKKEASSALEENDW